MIPVRRIGHATFDTPDLEKSVDYYTQFLGLSTVTRDKDSVYLACPSDFHSVVLNRASTARCSKLSLQLATDADLDAFTKHAKSLGIETTRRTDPEPDVTDVVSLTDPSGLTIDLFRGRSVPAPRAQQQGVVPRKLGHIAFFTADIQKTVKFYESVFGFRVSDWIGDFFVFMRCNPDHHTVNFFSGPNTGMHHIAFELNDWNHVKEACDLLPDHGLELVWGPGRHGPGHNIYTYHLNPDGHTVEMFTELDTMSDDNLGYFDPRPWHKERPQCPKVWEPNLMARNYWGITKPEPKSRPAETTAFVKAEK
jgi:catechol 2,3-dioxygenase-like lactoylglutathione lyase family enzyme